MKNLIFYLGLAFLFTHELDAMTNSEWLVLPLLNLLSDELGQRIFVLLLIPIFAVIIALIASDKVSVREKSRLGFSLFLTLHGVVHFAFMGHANYEFESTLSNILIFGGAVCGSAYLGLWYSGRKKYAN
jgi:hypothetical protein